MRKSYTNPSDWRGIVGQNLCKERSMIVDDDSGDKNQIIAWMFLNHIYSIFKQRSDMPKLLQSVVIISYIQIT